MVPGPRYPKRIGRTTRNNERPRDWATEMKAVGSAFMCNHLERLPRFFYYRAFSFTWPAAMKMFWNKRKFLHKKGSTPTGLVWSTNVAAVLLFCDTNMVKAMSCKNALLTKYSIN